MSFFLNLFPIYIKDITELYIYLKTKNIKLPSPPPPEKKKEEAGARRLRAGR